MDEHVEHVLKELAKNVVLTPAERALLVEQAEAMKVELEQFTRLCKDGSAGDAIFCFIEIVRGTDYMGTMVSQKVQQTAHKKMR